MVAETVHVFLCLLYFASAAWGGGNFSLKHALYDELLKDYNKYVRPVVNDSDAIKVDMGLSLLNIEDLDEKKQHLIAHFWFRLNWLDPQLAWEKKTTYVDITNIRLPSDKIWVPDIRIYNGVGDVTDDWATTLAVVNQKGNVLWIPPIRTQSSCALDLRKFPYDEQNCAVKFGSWTYNGFQLNLTTNVDELETLFAQPHLSWELAGSSVQRNTIYYPCCSEPYIDITVSLILRRRTAYVNHVFVGPSVILAFVIPLLFVLPVDSKEKMTLGVGVLVSQVLLLMMLEDAIPTAHPTVPLIGLYYLANIILIGFSLVFGALTINIWNRGSRNREVPGILRAIFLGILGRLLFVRREDYLSLEDLECARKGNLEGAEMTNSDTSQLVTKVTIMAEWRQFSAVVDRLLFVVYVIVLLCVTIIILS